MDVNAIYEQLWQRGAERIFQLLMPSLDRTFNKFFRSQIKVIFSETEAAEFLGVKKETLQAWRKRRLISFAQYPIGRIPKKENGEEADAEDDKLGETFTYRIDDLLSFQARYLQRCDAPNVYQLNPQISLIGAEVEEKHLKRVA